jgi:hypothetical protein
MTSNCNTQAFSSNAFTTHSSKICVCDKCEDNNTNKENDNHEFLVPAIISLTSCPSEQALIC